MNLLLQPITRPIGRQGCICISLAKRYASTKKSPSRGKLPDQPARTRFAPSPTGSLHLGSLRTALFNYLLAKATGGQFLLRIEDTDQKRTVPGAEQKLRDDLRWAGLDWDEGPGIDGPYGPYRQSERTTLYQEHAAQLLRSGHAYRCFCSAERLLILAKHRADLGLPTDYDRACTHVPLEEAEDRAANGEAHVIRLKVPTKYPEYNDIVYGLVRNKNEQRPLALSNPAFEDPILLKSDGFPTYHLANVVDDHMMKITHVVRGAEWMSSTPKHLAMYQAFGWEPPAFAHVGLLTDIHGQKLSKRNMDVDVASYRDKMGILPEALINFVALLGWSHGKKKDFMGMQDLMKNFSMKFTTGDTVVTFEKMWFLQKLHAGAYIDLAAKGDRSKLSFLTRSIVSALEDKVVPESILAGRSVTKYTEQLLELGARGYTNGQGFVTDHKFFFSTPEQSDLKITIPTERFEERSGMPNPTPAIHESAMSLHDFERITVESWDTEHISHCVDGIVNAWTLRLLAASHATGEFEQFETEVKARSVIGRRASKDVHDYIRWVLMAGMPGPPTVGALVVLGRAETLDRFRNAKVVSDQEGGLGYRVAEE